VPLLRSGWFVSYEVTDTTSTLTQGSYLSRITITSNGGLGCRSVEVQFQDGKRERQLLDRTSVEQTLSFTSTAAIERIVIDPEREFPLVVPPPNWTAPGSASWLKSCPGRALVRGP
jgi:hypothetical protein